MDFKAAYRFVSNCIDVEDESVCHQIEYVNVKGKKDTLKKVSCQEDIKNLNNDSNLCSIPVLNWEYQVRKMLEEAMGIKNGSSYEKKLFQTLITDYTMSKDDKKTSKIINEDMKKLINDMAIIDNTFVDFNNENFLTL